MKALLSKQRWQQTCEGYQFIDCAFRITEKNTAYLLAQTPLTQEEIDNLADDENIPTRLIAIQSNANSNDLVCDAIGVEGFDIPIMGVCALPAVNILLTTSNDIDGAVLPLGGGKNWDEETIDKGNLPFIERLKHIDGFAWAVTSRRGVYKRIAVGQWIKLDAGLNTNGDVGDIGFVDIDGFSDSDVYAVGGRGDIWHFDGKTWELCGFPTNDRLEAVCCAEDGHVYVAARNVLIRGRKHQWEVIQRYKNNYGYTRDARWFKDKLWICTSNRMLCWDDNEFSDWVRQDGKLLPLYAHMDANSDFMLVATPTDVWSYDGKTWRNIIPDYAQK